MVKYKCIGIGTTDSNGVAHLTHDVNGDELDTPGYEGQGVGEFDICASSDNPIKEDSFISGVVTVDDYVPLIEDVGFHTNKNIVQSGQSASFSFLVKDQHGRVIPQTSFDLCERFVVSSIVMSGDGVVQSGSSVNINAKVKTSSGGVPNNVPVVFKKGSTILDTVQTNDSGVAVYSFTGSGEGSVDVTANCDGVVSVPYPVLDCIAYDEGLSAEGHHNDNMWTTQSLTYLIRGEEYSSLTYESTQRSAYLINLSVGNAVEFEALMDSYTSGAGLMNVYERTGTSNLKSLNWISPTHLGLTTEEINGVWLNLKVEIEETGSRVTLVSNPTKTTFREYTETGTPNALRFTASSFNTSLKLKNVKVYPI